MNLAERFCFLGILREAGLPTLLADLEEAAQSGTDRLTVNVDWYDWEHSGIEDALAAEGIKAEELRVIEAMKGERVVYRLSWGRARGRP